MHPPRFLRRHLLSDWPECSIELLCCGGKTFYPTKLLAMRYGDLSFEEVLGRLRCGQCAKRPAPVYLCAGHRKHCGGAPPDWAIELVPEGGA